MGRKGTRPVIDVVVFYEGDATIYDAFGKVYAWLFREKLEAGQDAPLQETRKEGRVESS